MSALFKNKITKSIAIMLCALLCWQGIVWAAPDILLRDELQPETMFSMPDDPDNFQSAFTGYLASYLTKLELDPANHNLYTIKTRVESALFELRESGAIPAVLLSKLPALAGSPEDGEFVIDGGLYRIRYFNQRVAAPKRAEEPFKIIGEAKISEYLTRQVIVHASQDMDPFAGERGDSETGQNAYREKDTSGEENDAGSASLSYFGEKVFGFYSPFLHAPLFEEGAKIGLPLAALSLLNKYSPATPALNLAIFGAVLAVLGILFVSLHYFNGREKDSGINRIFGLYAAPVIVAAGGIVIAMLYSSDPAVALSLSACFHLTVNIAVKLLKKMGAAAGYAALGGGNKRNAIIHEAIKKAEEFFKGDDLTRDYDKVRAYISEKFSVDLQSDDYTEARVEIAKLCARQSPVRTMKAFNMFRIDPRGYASDITEIAIICARMSPALVVNNFKNLGLDPLTQGAYIADIVHECASLDGEMAAHNFAVFGLDPIADIDNMIEAAYLCARENGRATARFFRNFDIDPRHSEKEKRAVKKIALACAKENATGAATYFKNFGFDPAKDKDMIKEVAVACAFYSGRGTASNFMNFGLDPSVDKETVLEIAGMCAMQDLESTLEFFDNFGLGWAKKKAEEFCNEIEREHIMRLAAELRKDQFQFNLGENGLTILTMVDESFDSLDLSGLSIGSQAYVKALLLEQAVLNEGISTRFVDDLRAQVVPSLRTLEVITRDLPSFGVDHAAKVSWDNEKDRNHAVFRIKLLNYLSRVKTRHNMARSYIWQDGTWKMRVPPAPYPVEYMLVNKLGSLGIIDARDSSLTVAGDYAREAFFIFAAVYFATARQPAEMDDPALPGYPWIKAGNLGSTIDPWTGKLLQENDARTHGTQTQFMLSASQKAIGAKMRMTFALVSAAAAYMGEYGVKDETLKGLYKGFRGELLGFMKDKMGIGKYGVERLFPSMQRYAEYEFNEAEVRSSLDRIYMGFKKEMGDGETQLLEKEQLHQGFREIVERYSEKMIEHVMPGRIGSLADEIMNGKFGGTKQTVLSMCFDDDPVRRTAARIAGEVYPVEYGKIVEADDTLKPEIRPEALAIKGAAGPLANRLVNAMVGFSEKEEKVVLALDTGLGTGEINLLLKSIIDLLPDLEKNNEDLKKFFRNLVVVKDEGAKLAERLYRITDPSTGSVKPGNVIVVTKFDHLYLYDRLEWHSTVAAIDDTGFPETAYLPLLEIMLFAIGKHLGWSENALKEHYRNIPNVLSLDSLELADQGILFGGDRRILVIRLIPDATRFDRQEMREIMENIKVMLAQA